MLGARELTGPTAAAPWLDGALGDGKALEDVLVALDPLLYMLNLAGWDTLEVVVARPKSGVAEYVTVDMAEGVADLHPLGWAATYGYAVRATTYALLAVRIARRMHLGSTADLYAIAVDGPALRVDAGVHRAEHHVLDPGTGGADWIVLESADASADLANVAAGAEAAFTPLLADALADAFEAAVDGAGVPCGILKLLAPDVWDTPLEAIVSTTGVQSAAQAFWDWFVVPGNMRAVLLADRSAKAYRVGNLLRVVAGSPAIVDWSKYMTTPAAARLALLHPSSGSGRSVVAGLARENVLVAFLLLHELSVIRLFPYMPPETNDYTSPSGMPDLDLTGFYESYDPAGGVPALIATLQIEQAGKWLVGRWYDENLLIDTLEGTLDGTHTAGDLRSDDIVRTTPTGDSWEDEVLEVDATSTPTPTGLVLTVTLRNHDVVHFYRRDALPRPATALVEALSPDIRDRKVEPYLVPLHSERLAAVDAAAAAIRDAVEAWYATEDAAEARALDGVVEQQFVELGCPPYFQGQALPPDDWLERVRMEMAKALLAYRVVAVPTAPMLHTLGTAVSTYPAETGATQAYFQLTPSPPSTYEYWTEQTGFGLTVGEGVEWSVGGFEMSLHLKRTLPTPWSREEVYTGTLGEVGLGMGAEVPAPFVPLPMSIEFYSYDLDTNDVVTSQDWSKEDFEGPFWVFGYEGSGSFFAGLSGGGKELFVFWGSDPAKGPAWGIGGGTAVTLGLAISIGAGGSIGRADLSLTRAGTGSVVTPPVFVQLSDATTVESWFEVNEDAMSDDGVAALGRTAAAFRAMLASPVSTVLILGTTSTTAGEAHNLDLARRRANATWACLRDLLGDGLAVPDENVGLYALGEAPALAAGVPDATEIADWRRTLLIVNGTRMLVI